MSNKVLLIEFDLALTVLNQKRETETRENGRGLRLSPRNTTSSKDPD